MNQLYNAAAHRRSAAYAGTLCIASCLSVFYLFTNRAVSLLGAAALGVTILLCLCRGAADFGRRGANITECLWALTVGFGVILLMKNPGTSAVYQWAQMVLLLFMHTIFNRVRLGQREYRRMKKIYSALFWILCVMYIGIEAAGLMQASKNVVSATMIKCIVPLSFFAIDIRKNGVGKVILLAVACLYMGERTAVIILLAVYVFYLMLTRWKSRAFWYALFAAVLAMAVALPFVYVWMSHQPWRAALDAFSFQYTGGRFFSGRNEIWRVIIDGVADHRLTGLGFGSSLLRNYGITLSTHNVYMYLYLCGGVALVALFGLYMASIWQRYFRRRNMENTAHVAAYFLGLILFMDFELFMIANNFVVSLFWWLMLTLPVNLCGGEQRTKA